MYVTNFDSDTVSVIDTATNTVVGDPITVGNGPRGMLLYVIIKNQTIKTLSSKNLYSSIAFQI